MFVCGCLGQTVTMNERDLPYKSAEITSSVIGEGGAELKAGNVRVFYPPGSLPLGTRVDMLVSFLSSDFITDGQVKLSPQVTIGPHLNLSLDHPIQLSLPLKISGGDSVIVRRSDTECTEQLVWKDVLDSDYMISNGLVTIFSVGNTIYQSFSGPEDSLHKLKIKGEEVFFSIRQKSSGTARLLQLKCADTAALCNEETDDAELLHQAVNVRVPPGTDLQLVMFRSDKTIQQLATPFDGRKRLHEPLDEEVYIIF